MIHTDSNELSLFLEICKKVDKLFGDSVTATFPFRDVGEYDKYERGYVTVSKSWLPVPKNIIKQLSQKFPNRDFEIKEEKITDKHINLKTISTSRILSFD